MKDSLDILRTDINYDEGSIEHHGIKGMRWGVRREEVTKGDTTNTTSNNHGFTGRKKNKTKGDGKGAHKRGEGKYTTSGWNFNTGDINQGVGGSDSYFNSIQSGMGQAPISTQLGQALYSAVYKEARETEEYRNIQKLLDEFKKLADTRSKTWNQGSTAASMVFEEKANKLIQEINSNLSNLDEKFYDKTKMIKQTAYKDFSPSKSLAGIFSSYSNTIKFDEKTGRITKGWKSPPSVANNSVGYNLKNKTKSK